MDVAVPSKSEERPLICGSCGAPLTKAPEGPFAACEHCGSHFSLPSAKPDGTLDGDLAHVERWWEGERRRFMTIDRHGHLHPPEEQHPHHIVLMAAGGILALISLTAGSTLDSMWVGVAGFFVFPVLISLPAALLHERAERRYKEYQQLEAEYRGRRNAILARSTRQR